MKLNKKRILAALVIVLLLAAAFFAQNGSVFNSGPSANISASAKDVSVAPASENAVSPEISAVPSEIPDSNTASRKPSQKTTEATVPAYSAQPKETTAQTETKESACSLTISCKTILDNMDKLVEGKETLVPANGWLLSLTDVKFAEGETAFDILQRELKARNMHLEFSVSPLYNTVYIEGICNLYEFDCGELSGWMYSVNGVFLSYGCDQYKLSDGDAVAFVYTCDLGRDVGEG